MLARTVDLARRAADGLVDVEIVVVTDDDRVEALAQSLACPVVRTSPALGSGSARVLAAARLYQGRPEYVVNLQGDTPFLPVAAVRRVLETLQAGAEVATPVIRLGWSDLDRLREHKSRTPFSGTTCIVDERGEARWFSKQIIPAIRNEADARRTMPTSPVHRHVGLYGYRMAALERFEAARPSFYEEVEGLEQLRFVDLGIAIRAVVVAPDAVAMSGIDTLADVALAEALIARHGDPYHR